jgi:hypothetical protein
MSVILGIELMVFLEHSDASKAAWDCCEMFRNQNAGRGPSAISEAGESLTKKNIVGFHVLQNAARIIVRPVIAIYEQATIVVDIVEPSSLKISGVEAGIIPSKAFVIRLPPNSFVYAKDAGKPKGLFIGNRGHYHDDVIHNRFPADVVAFAACKRKETISNVECEVVVVGSNV